MATRTRTVRTPEKRTRFLAALESGSSVASACRRAAIGRQTAYDWRKADETFASAWDGVARAQVEAAR
jgi:transposase-like protein